MKKYFFYREALLCLVIALGALGCDKEDDPDVFTCTTCTQTPQAKAEFNSSSAGVYKGVMVGSSGTIAFYLLNDGVKKEALVVFDGKSAVLTTTDLNNWSPGQAINNALFTGTLNGQQIQVRFSVNANGTGPSVQVNIPNHSVTVGMYKETSSSLVKSFEGTYAGSSSGTLNIVMIDNSFQVIVKGQVIARATLVNGKVDFMAGPDRIQGEFINPDLLKGTYTRTTDSNHKGTWEAKRTL